MPPRRDSHGQVHWLPWNDHHPALQMFEVSMRSTEAVPSPQHGASAQGLANTEKVALAVFEPRTLLTDSLAGIISSDFGDPIGGLETG